VVAEVVLPVPAGMHMSVGLAVLQVEMVPAAVVRQWQVARHRAQAAQPATIAVAAGMAGQQVHWELVVPVHVHAVHMEQEAAAVADITAVEVELHAAVAVVAVAALPMSGD